MWFHSHVRWALWWSTFVVPPSGPGGRIGWDLPPPQSTTPSPPSDAVRPWERSTQRLSRWKLLYIFDEIESESGFQVSRKQLTLPSRLSRLALVLVHTLGPGIFASVLKLLEKKLRDPKFDISSAARQSLLNFISLLNIFASGLQRLHTCLFYLQVSSSRRSHLICLKSKLCRAPIIIWQRDYLA